MWPGYDCIVHLHAPVHATPVQAISGPLGDVNRDISSREVRPGSLTGRLAVWQSLLAMQSYAAAVCCDTPLHMFTLLRCFSPHRAVKMVISCASSCRSCAKGSTLTAGSTTFKTAGRPMQVQVRLLLGMDLCLLHSLSRHINNDTMSFSGYQQVRMLTAGCSCCFVVG
jgi:hypothetical protein